MQTKLIIILLVTGAVFMQSCTTLKRYKSAKNSETDNTLADINLFGFRLSQAKPEKESKNLWDLSADAQSQFLRILNSRYPDNEMFINSLNFKYMNSQVEILSDDYTNKELRLIFSVSKKRDYTKTGSLIKAGLSPADRIEYLKISLDIPEKSKLRFTGWNMFTTDYGSVDIADVSFSRNLDQGASAYLSAGSEPVKGNSAIEGKSSFSRKEDQAIKYRYLKLNGRISEKEIEMEEEGTREIDLTGNIIADVSLEFDKFPEVLTSIFGLKDSTGKFNEADKLVISYSDVVVPYQIDPEDTIKAIVKMDYIYRNVGSGRRTFQEWDDRVKYFSGSIEKTFPLFAGSRYLPHFYCIGTDCPQKELVRIKTASDNLITLKFGTYREALGFYEWLKYYFSKKEHQGKAVSIGEQVLVFKNGNLTIDHILGDSCFRVLSYY
jgi:hypothetical protein